VFRGNRVERPNHAWVMNLTYIPVARGFVYLTAVVDGFNRRAPQASAPWQSFD